MIEISLPEPYPLQIDIMNHPAKRKVICAGRRAGKTTLAALIAVERFLLGQRILLTSTTQDQADAFWDKAKIWLHPLIARGLVYKNENRRIMEIQLDNTRTGRLRVKTGQTSDILRGDDADLIVFDECALLDPETWFAVAAPMLADRDGDAVFISTPRRRNWFFHLHQKADMGDDPRWKAWHFTTLANPYLSQIALAELASDMTEETYKQEILAQFLEGEGQVFRRIREAAILSPVEPIGQRTVMGIDWAKEQDYTVLTVMDRDTKQLLEMDRFNKVDWAFQRERVKLMYDKWHPSVIHGEANSIGSPNLEALWREGLPIRPFTTTARSKPPLIENLVLAFERGDIQILDNPILIGELEAYERKQTALGNSQYSAPNGLHDDCVMSLALCYQVANESLIQSAWVLE